jgi:hypothetical protein
MISLANIFWNHEDKCQEAPNIMRKSL